MGFVGIAAGAVLGSFLDWFAFWFGAFTTILAIGATTYIHKAEIGEAIARRKWNSHLTFPALAITFLLCVAGYAVYRSSFPKPDPTEQLLSAIRESRTPAAQQGQLTYANYEAKLYHCPIKPGVAFGSVVMQASQFPLTIVRIDGKPLIEVDRVQGSITFKQLYLYDEQDQLIASINDNNYWVKPGYRTIQHMPADLAVFGPGGELLLRVVLLNSDLLSVEGKFRYHNKTVEIANRQVTAGLVQLREQCLLNNSIYVDGAAFGFKLEPAPWFHRP